MSVNNAHKTGTDQRANPTKLLHGNFLEEFFLLKNQKKINAAMGF